MDSYCATFSPSPKNHLNHKNHSQDGWVWVLRPLLIYFSRLILNNHLNQKNHSLDDGYGYCVLYLFTSHATSSTII